MQDAPLISIITVVLNEKKGLQRSIESIVQQGYSRLEHIVIDGGSTDGTLDVIRAHEKEIGYWISEPDRGISHAINKGITSAGGDLIAILNAGDWYEPNTLQMVAGAHQAHPEAEVLCGALRFWERGEPTIVAYSNPARLDKETSVYHPAVFIKKTAYEKYGLYDEGFEFAMDYELLLRFKRRGARFIALDTVLANMSLDGISNRHWYRGLREVRKARSAYFGFPDVIYRHSLAVIKNVGARLLKRSGLRVLYEKHWELKSRSFASRARGEE